MRALNAIKTSKTPTQNKIDSRLYLGLLHRRADPRLSLLTDFRYITAATDGQVAVDIAVISLAGIKPVIAEVAALGGSVRVSSSKFRTVAARVPIDSLETLAAVDGVRWVHPAMGHKTQKVNTSEGDKTHGASEARGFFGVNGTGVKVCVLSDGVDSLSILETSGDLPPSVDVLPGQAGSGDEGSAMLEIIHDLAPGAALGFATADTSEASFAQNILDLATAGCNIIVDDVVYFDESPFEDGPVAQSVNTVTSGGVLYFSSAGNAGNLDAGTSATWEGDFKGNGTISSLPVGAGTAHDFGDGGQSILVTGGAADVALIWAEHYDLAGGIASTDFDLYDMDGGLTTVFDESTNTQDGTGGDDVPVEITGQTFQGERMVVVQFAAGTTSSPPMFNLALFGNSAAVDPALGTNGATRGHNSAAAAFSVGATPAAAAFESGDPVGPYPALFTSATVNELFTSDGPRRIILDTTGAELTPNNRTSTGGVVRQKPDITAADGVSCAAPGFAPFFGTSAAAPHAAAIAALLKSAVPGLTQAQVRTALISSAIDIEAAGTDRDSGAGIVMAHAALTAVGATAQAFLAAGTAVPSQVIGDGDAFIEPNETWALAIPLTNNGGLAATAVSAVLTSSTPGVTFGVGSSAYPDLAVGATASNTTPFHFTLGSTATCGGFIQFTLTVSYSGGTSPQVFNFSLQTGGPGTPQTFSYTGPEVAIPDSPGANTPGTAAFASLLISGVSGGIFDLNLSIDGTSCSSIKDSTTVGITHSFINDLEVSLISPASTSVLAINRIDGGGNNLCQTVLDDESGGPSIQGVSTAQAPFTGTFTPNLPLSTFRGESANGTWQLEAQDFFIGDTGSLRAFSLIITPAVCNAPIVNPPIISATKAVTGGTLIAGGTVVYTVVLHNSGLGTQTDNPGNEFTDTLPADLTVGTPTASSGTVSGASVNPVTWNGSIAPGASVTITIPATIHAGTEGHTITNQGMVSYDANGDGTNDTNVATFDPPNGGATTFEVPAAVVPIGEVPTLSGVGLSLLGAMLALAAVGMLLRGRRVS
jgi:subtilisin-like proprotein convertase family protein